MFSGGAIGVTNKKGDTVSSFPTPDEEELFIGPAKTPVKINGKVYELSLEEVNQVKFGKLPRRIGSHFPTESIQSLLSKMHCYIERVVPIAKFENSQQLRVYATIKNGEHGEILYLSYNQKEGKFDARTIFRFNGSIKGVVKYKGRDEYYISAHLDGKDVTLEKDAFVREIARTYYLSQSEAKKLKEIIDNFIIEEEKNKNIEERILDRIYVDEEVVHVVDTTGLALQEVLKNLHRAFEIFKDKRAFLTLLGYSILSTLHYEIKKRAKTEVQVPLVVEWGDPRIGKTRTATLFAVRGFGQTRDVAVFGLNRIRTPFMLGVTLNLSNLPAVVDDVNVQWLNDLSEYVKDYVSSPEFMARGTKDLRVKTYSGRRSFIATLNEEFRSVDSLAEKNRFIHLNFTRSHALTPDEWEQIYRLLPEGWLYPVVHEILDGRKIDEIVAQIEKITSSIGYANWGLVEINKLCEKHLLPMFPLIDEERSNEPYYEDPGLLFCTEILNEHAKLTSLDQSLHSEIRGAYLIEEVGGSVLKIWFTATTYKKIARRLGISYKTVSDFLSNIPPNSLVKVLNDAKPRAKRIPDLDFPLLMYCIAMLKVPKGVELDMEDDKNEYKDE